MDREHLRHPQRPPTCARDPHPQLVVLSDPEPLVEADDLVEHAPAEGDGGIDEVPPQQLFQEDVGLEQRLDRRTLGRHRGLRAHPSAHAVEEPCVGVREAGGGRRSQRGVHLDGVVRQPEVVAVDHADERARGLLDRRVPGRPGAAVLLAEQAHSVVAGREPGGDLRGAVARTVVDHDQLEVRAGLTQQHRADRRSDRPLGVERRHDDAETRDAHGEPGASRGRQVRPARPGAQPPPIMIAPRVDPGVHRGRRRRPRCRTRPSAPT